MILKSCKIVEIADIHFGNGKVSPINEYEHLQKYLYPELETANLLIINGDTFDTLLNMNSDAGLYVAKFIDDLINYAIYYKFYIRVVRGTFSHDRHQNRFFTVKDKCKHKLNDKELVRVFDKITVEHFDDLKLDILYCPDDQPYEDLTQAVLDVLSANHLDKIDMICSHGYYDHLLPVDVLHVPHDILYWKKLKDRVKGLVFNGHVHHKGVFDERVISSGSFERFDHSVIEPVGFWIAEIENNKWSFKFIENKDAIPFKTFYSTMYESQEEFAKAICDYVDEIYENGYNTSNPIYIRISGLDNGVSSLIKDRYENVIVTIKHNTTQPLFEDEIKTDCDELPIITEENLAAIVYENLGDNPALTLAEVEEIINDI